MTNNAYTKLYASTIAPDPAIDALWIDLSEDRRGSIIKFWDGARYLPISLGQTPDTTQFYNWVEQAVSQAKSEAISASAVYTDSQVALIDLAGMMTITADNSNVATLKFDSSVSESQLSAGELRWSQEEGTLDLGMNHGGVVQSIGLELYYHVENKSGVDIQDGDLVMSDGTDGNSGKIKARKAGPGVNPALILGVATEDISNGNFGFVTWFGKLRGINTSGSDVSESWANGDVLYAHPSISGKMTKVKPIAPANKMPIGIVISPHHTMGTMFVRLQRSISLDDINNVNTMSVSSGQLLTSAIVSGVPVWSNKTINADDIPETATRQYFNQSIQADIDSKMRKGLITSRNQLLNLLGTDHYGAYIMKFIAPEELVIRDSDDNIYAITSGKVLFEYYGATVGTVIKVHVDNATSTGFIGPITGFLHGLNYIGNTTQLILSPLDTYGDPRVLASRIKDLEDAIISSLYTPDGLSEIVKVDSAGNVHINGDIYQHGSAYETHAEDIFTKQDIMTLRDGATAALSPSHYAGLVAKLYDGTFDGGLVFGPDGVARVGDVAYDKGTDTWLYMDAQPLMTREEAPADKSMLYWDASESKAKTAVQEKSTFTSLDKLTVIDSDDNYIPKTISWANAFTKINEDVNANMLVYISDDDISVLMGIGALAVISESTTGYPSVTIQVESL